MSDSVAHQAGKNLENWRRELTDVLVAQQRQTTGHDLAHAERVWRNAQQIAEGEETAGRGTADRLVLLAAAYLHDLVAVEKNSPERHLASTRSAAEARTLLLNKGWKPEQVEAVAHAVEAHSFSANIPTRTLEAQILQDADRLESLGAVGIARCFAVVGRLDSQLFDGEDPLAKRRPLDDRRFGLDHFFTKLYLLPAKMNTESAKQMARSRCDTMDLYVRALLKELGEPVEEP